MQARAYWKGYLRLSLVTIGVELYTATTRTSSLSLHQILKPSGKRIRYQKIVPGIGPVDTDEIVKGFTTSRDEYVLLESDELDELKLESKGTIELVQFVEYGEIDPRYFERPYYVIPAEGDVAGEGFVVIREALRKSKRVALGQQEGRAGPDGGARARLYRRDQALRERPASRNLALCGGDTRERKHFRGDPRNQG